MHTRFATFLIVLLSLSSVVSRAQDAQPTVSRAGRIFSHVDVGISGTAFMTKDVSGRITSGAPNAPYDLTQSASSAAGVMGIIRAQKSPYKGLEFNLGYGRVTENWTCCNYNSTTGTSAGPFASQAKTLEYSFGYLVRPPHEFFGVQPFLSAGAGVLAFAPTTFGGQGLKPQARMEYYYHVGGEKMLTESFGVRAGLRQLFYKAPDFDQNYLRITKTTFTIQPEFGLFYHF